MNRLIIVGASGHGKVIADIAKLNGYEEIVFLDNDCTITSCAGIPVFGSDSMIANLEGDLFIAIGNSDIRRNYMELHEKRHFPILIHPSAVLASDTTVGEGTVIMAGSVINPNAKVGRGCIINTASSIDHDCILHDYVHIAVGAHLCGSVCVGNDTWIGAGSIVSNNLDICPNCTIGAGSVVVKSLAVPGTYCGVPAKLQKR